MKKLFTTLMVLTMASATVMTSCKKSDDAADATIDITAKVGGTAINSGDAVNQGSTVNFTVVVAGNSDNKLKEISVTSSNPDQTIVSSASISGTSATKTFDFVASNSGSSVITVSVVSDKNTVTKSYTITVNGPSNYAIGTDNGELGNQKDGSPIFWSSTAAATYKLSDVKANPSLASKIDIGYASRTTGNRLIAPSSADATAIYSDQWSAADEKITTWTHRSSTKFKVLTNVTVSEFTAASDETSIKAMIAKAKSAGEPSDESVSVANNSVVLFKTEGGYYGVMQAVDVTGTVVGGSATAGRVNFIAKYQKPM